MGLFGKKKRKQKLQFSEYTPPKSKQKKGEKLLTSYDTMKYFTVHTDTEDELFKICDTLLDGKAILANFDQLNPTAANRMLSFISGVVYAKSGEIYQISERIFLFARKEEFEDGSLYQYIEDTR